MSVEDTKNNLTKKPEFGYYGDADVSFLPGNNRLLIETDPSKNFGSDFLERCYFQFLDDYLFIITINVNTNNMDYYSMFTTLQNKYGEPTSFNPQEARWVNDSTTISLEKPLTLKYIDNKTFEQSISNGQIDPAPVEITREMFLDDL